MNPKVSIIIPVYGVEKYIERCITSVLNQTYRNLEVILVDDCTPDNSIKIARNTIEGNERSCDLIIRILHHDINKGQSAARNTAIKEATGDYLFFLDSDDEITENCIEELVKPLNTQKYDIICGGCKVIEENNCKLCKSAGEIHDRDNMIRYFAEGKFGAMPWNKLVNTTFLRSNNLVFCEGVLHEDLLWNFQLACLAKNLYCVNNYTYNYYIYPNSSSRSKEKQKKRVDSLEIVFRKIYQYQQSICSFDYLTDTAIRFFIPLFEETVRAMPDFSLKQYYKKLRHVDCRDRRQKMMVYDTFARKLRYFDYFLPIPLGFAYRYLCWTLVKIKAGRKDIPFVY